MSKVKKNTTIREYQDFIKEVYGIPNDRHFSLWDMISNMERFTMRGLKGIRKGDKEKTKLNLLISLSWFTSLMNRLHIDVEEDVWQRFPYLCSYCGSCPCCCKEKKVDRRKKITIDNSKRPKTLEEFQLMFNEIYPAQERTLDHAGVHLAEEIGEFSEAILAYRGGREDGDFEKVELEASDLFSCQAGVFNSLGVSMAKELSVIFSKNCHVCKKSPCVCDFTYITKFKS
jgi:NTP pyrophosphatase (non-canonical NTP hydrolase)